MKKVLRNIPQIAISLQSEPSVMKSITKLCQNQTINLNPSLRALLDNFSSLTKHYL